MPEIDIEQEDGLTPGTAPTSEGALSLDLTFAPAWAKRPPKTARTDTPGNAEPVRTKDTRDTRDRPDRSGMRNDRRKPRREERVERRVSRPEPPPPLPSLDLRILPAARPLASVVRQIHSSKKAYPLRKLALLFLSKYDHCVVKIEPRSDQHGIKLFQCDRCHMVAIDRSTIAGHAFKAHLAEFFDNEEKEIAAPSGQFVCIGRCRRSGTLLGPPNHHNYNEKLEETRSTRFPELSLDEYKKGVEIVHDQALIEQWKDQTKRQVMYRLKSPADNVQSEPMKWAQAVAVFNERILPSLILEKSRVNFPGGLVGKIEDSRLARVIADELQAERRNPRSMVFAMRMAFRHMHLHLFRAGRYGDLVSTVKPMPLDWEHAVDSVRMMATYLRDHQGCTRKMLLAHFSTTAESSASQKDNTTSTSLRWLIDKGHLVELFDGTLLVPPSSQDHSNAAGNKDSNAASESSADRKEVIVDVTTTSSASVPDHTEAAHPLPQTDRS